MTGPNDISEMSTQGLQVPSAYSAKAFPSADHQTEQKPRPAKAQTLSSYRQASATISRMHTHHMQAFWLPKRTRI